MLTYADVIKAAAAAVAAGMRSAGTLAGEEGSSTPEAPPPLPVVVSPSAEPEGRGEQASGSSNGSIRTGKFHREKILWPYSSALLACFVLSAVIAPRTWCWTDWKALQ